MEKDVALGSFGSLSMSFAAGKAMLAVTGGMPAGGLSMSLSVSEDAGALIDKLFAAIEAASPAGAMPIEESVKALVKAAVLAVK